MIYSTVCSKCGRKEEISKPMMSSLPRCSACKSTLRRLWRDSPSIIYAAAGFYATDYGRFEKQVGAEKAAKFRASKDEIEGRAVKGRLTGYEKAVEAVG